jgi:hypothetical protein
MRTLKPLKVLKTTLLRMLFVTFPSGKSARKAVGAQGLFKKNKFGIAGAREDLFSFMTGTIDDAKYAGIYGQKAADAAKSMRLQVDGMTDVLYKQIEGASMDPKEKARLLKELRPRRASTCDACMRCT